MSSPSQLPEQPERDVYAIPDTLQQLENRITRMTSSIKHAQKKAERYRKMAQDDDFCPRGPEHYLDQANGIDESIQEWQRLCRQYVGVIQTRWPYRSWSISDLVAASQREIQYMQDSESMAKSYRKSAADPRITQDRFEAYLDNAEKFEECAQDHLESARNTGFIAVRLVVFSCLHKRLGEESPMRVLGVKLLDSIIGSLE